MKTTICLLTVLAVAAASAQTPSSTTTTKNGTVVQTDRNGNLREGALNRTVTGSQGKTTVVDKTYDYDRRDGETSQTKNVTGPSGKSYRRDGHTTYTPGTANNTTTWTAANGKQATANGTFTRNGRTVTGSRGASKTSQRNRR